MDEEYRIIDANPKRGRSRFGKREIRDIAISMVVLAIAFMILYRDNQIMGYLAYHLGNDLAWIALFATCLALVFFSFLLHELGHKIVAQNHGLWSEFRMYPAGLVLTLVTSMFGFLFAAPGAVMIAGYPDKEMNGRISIAGPIVNIVLAAIGIVGCIALNGSPIILFLLMFASLNSFLAFFNLLPIPPLDGSKIVTWNVAIYVIVIAVAILELVFLFKWMPPLYFTY